MRATNPHRDAAPRVRRRDGLTIVEILIAMTVLTVGVAGILKNSASVATEMKTAEEAIVSGKLKPFSGPIKDQSGAERVAAGAALPDQEIRTMTWLVDGVQGTLPKT